MLLAFLFGLNPVGIFVIGSVAYASSSSITAKMIEEAKRIANPETEFILALLIFEDLLAPILVSLIAGLYSGAGLSMGFLLILLLKIVGFTVGAVLIGAYGFRRLQPFVSAYLDKDFMPLLAVGLALGYAGLAVFLGLSEVLGAFLAGVMLSETGRSSELSHLIFPIRDVMLPFFFFWFGTTISLGQGVPWPGLLVGLVLWGVIGKVLTGYLGGRSYGLSPRVSWRAGLSLVQRGEFSALIASLAAPPLRILSGLYILSMAVIGVASFQNAPNLARWITNTPKAPPAGTPKNAELSR